MPLGSAHHSAQVTKLLLLGDSGTGKTGALASLVPDYNLRVLDFDNGVDILINAVTKDCPQRLDSIAYETCTDPFKNLNGRMIPRKAEAWAKGIKLLDNWKTDEYDLGKVSDWGPKDILVIDSFTHAGKAAMRYVQSLQGKLGEHPRIQDWGTTQTLVEDLLAMLYDVNLRCNVIVTAHIDYIYEALEGPDVISKAGTERSPTRGYPSAPGSKLSPKVGSYFNSTLQIVKSGSGSGTRRRIHTQPQGVVDLKNSNPSKVKRDYPLETGLAEFFKDVRS